MNDDFDYLDNYDISKMTRRYDLEKKFKERMKYGYNTVVHYGEFDLITETSAPPRRTIGRFVSFPGSEQRYPISLCEEDFFDFREEMQKYPEIREEFEIARAIHDLEIKTGLSQQQIVEKITLKYPLAIRA